MVNTIKRNYQQRVQAGTLQVSLIQNAVTLQWVAIVRVWDEELLQEGVCGYDAKSSQSKQVCLAWLAERLAILADACNFQQELPLGLE